MESKARLNIVDYSTIVYLLLTTVLIFSYFNKIENPMFHIFVRMGFFGILIASVFIRNHSFKGKVNMLASLLPLAFLGYFYNETANFNHLFLNSYDAFISQIEFEIFNFQPSIVFSQIFSNYWFSELMNFGYFSYYLLIFFIPVIFYFKKPEHFQQMLFSLLTSFYLFYLFFIIIPVVGPQFYFQDSLGEFTPQGPFGFVISFIQEVGEVPTGAFPSSHVGISLLLGYFIFKHFRKYFVFLVIIISVLILSTVYIKAHYVLDVIASILVTPLFYYISNKLYIPFTNPNRNI